MLDSQDRIWKLMRQLYPTGRAFRFPKDGHGEGVHLALAASLSDMYDGAVSTMDSLIPDNERFTVEDARVWERALGLITNEELDLEDRKAAILRKMAAPGTQAAKGHYLNLQRQLQLAGFDVYVHENRFDDYPNGYVTQNPATINPLILSESQHGDCQHGELQSHYINQVVANNIANEDDLGFNVGTSLRYTFFIGGEVLGTYASVPASRETEFRQLILRLKRLHTIAYLFITYT